MNIFMICTLWTPFQAERDWKNSYREILLIPLYIFYSLWVKLNLIVVKNTLVKSYFILKLTRIRWLTSRSPSFNSWRARGRRWRLLHLNISIWNDFIHLIKLNFLRHKNVRKKPTLNTMFKHGKYLGWGAAVFRVISE